MDYLNLALGGRIGSTTRQRLDGTEYRIRVLWLAEAVRVPFQFDNVPPPLVFGTPGVWTLNVAQADGTLILAGQILRHGVNVLAPFSNDPRFPSGRLLAFDRTGLRRDPGRDDLNPDSDVRLIYVPANEVT